MGSDCQTPCCIAGHTLSIEPPTFAEREGLVMGTLTFSTVAQRRLKLPTHIASYVFSPIWPREFAEEHDGFNSIQTDYFEPSSAYAVRFLDRLLNGDYDVDVEEWLMRRAKDDSYMCRL